MLYTRTADESFSASEVGELSLSFADVEFSFCCYLYNNSNNRKHCPSYSFNSCCVPVAAMFTVFMFVVLGQNSSALFVFTYSLCHCDIPLTVLGMSELEECLFSF